MGFPGRYEEKKRPYVGMVFVCSVVALVIWGIWHVAQVMRAPLPVQKQKTLQHQIVVTEPPGLVRQAAENLEQDTRRISKADVLGASKRKQQPTRSAVIYSTGEGAQAPGGTPEGRASDDYYGGR